LPADAKSNRIFGYNMQGTGSNEDAKMARVVRMIKSRRMRWAGHITRLGKMDMYLKL
jgi:hypothetical protein